MPRRIEWLEQLPNALDELRRFPSPVIDRAVLERVLRVHRRVAIRLMRRFRGVQSGKTFLIDRLQLIEQMEKFASGDEGFVQAPSPDPACRPTRGSATPGAWCYVRIEAASDVRDRQMKDLSGGVRLK